MTTTVTPDRLGHALDEGRPLVMLDVRTPGEFEQVRIRGSVNVPLERLRTEVTGLAGSATGAPGDVVVLCQSGRRAQDAAAALGGAGVTGVRVLEGGVAAWRDSGHPVDTGKGAWEMERQVRLVAGGVVLTSVLASTVLPRAKWVAGGIGAGLTFAALTDTCAMAAGLARMPWNRRSAPTTRSLVDALA